MSNVPIQRQFNGTMRLIEVQLRRAAETYDIEKNLQKCQDKGMLTAQDADFIRYTFELKARVDGGEELDEAEAAEVIHRLHKLVAMNLNMGDCA